MNTPNTYPEIEEAIDDFFKTMPGLDLTRVAWENVKLDPNPRATWWATEMLSISRVPQGPGQFHVDLWQGSYQVKVNVPIDYGKRQYTTLAQTVMNHFARGKSFNTTADLAILLQTPYPVKPIGAGSWLTIPVICPWLTFEILGVG